ncbi:MAG: L-2-amino-thiazoline-4-carboxylic acid hydrolase [Saonia sp.]
MKNENDRYEYFQKPFIESLKEKMPDGSLLNEKAVISRSSELVALNKDLWEDQQSYEHLHTTSLVIASYEALKKLCGVKTALEIIRYAFVDSLSFITRQTEQFLNASKDPFSAIVEISKQKEEAYGKTFSFYRKQDDDLAYLLEIKKCFYCKVLKLNKAEELMPIFCDFDTNWMMAINPEKHKFKFERPETIGTGGNICKFYFTRTDPK